MTLVFDEVGESVSLKHQTQKFAYYNVRHDRRLMPVDFFEVSL